MFTGKQCVCIIVSTQTNVAYSSPQCMMMLLEYMLQHILDGSQCVRIKCVNTSDNAHRHILTKSGSHWLDYIIEFKHER